MEITFPTKFNKAYFLQTGSDPSDWQFMPSIIAEDDLVKRFEAHGVAQFDSFFARTVVVENVPAASVQTGDYDFDGFSNLDEVVILNTNPLDRDTNRDGVNDGVEDCDQDGLADGWKRLVIAAGDVPVIVETRVAG